jgi:large subunit ribosomal protein L10
MAREQKELMVDEISSILKSAPNLYVSHFANIDAEKCNDLRDELEEKSSHYFVVKNRLCRLALKKAKLQQLDEFVDGPTAFILCKDNPIDISKVLVDFSKEEEGFSIVGGYINGEILKREHIKELASLPPRDQLIYMFTTVIKSPINQFASVLRQCIKGLVVSLSEISKKKQEQSKKK